MAALAISWFAPPERDPPAPLAPPVALPLPLPAETARGVGAPATPATRRRTQACDGAAGRIVEPPRPIGSPAAWFRSDDYPWVSLARNHQGIAAVEIGVSETGAVIACGVGGSSGHFSLDRTTCAIFRQRARFIPAHDDRGCPVAAMWHQRVRWVIPDR